MNEKWDCYLCGHETNFYTPASGFLGNYHPLCMNCTNKVLDDDHPHKFRMTYHYGLGNVEIIANVPISKNRYNSN